MLSSRAVTPCCSPHRAPLPGAPASRRWQSDFPSRHPAGPRSLHRAASDIWGWIILCRGGCRVCCGVCSSVRSPRRHRQHCPLGNDNQYVSTHSRMSPGRAKPHTVKSHWVKSIPQGLGFFLTVDLEIILTHRKSTTYKRPTPFTKIRFTGCHHLTPFIFPFDSLSVCLST